MSIFDEPSRWTTDQIFNRLCRSVERPYRHPMGDRSVLQKARGHALARTLAAKMTELDGQIGSLNVSRAELYEVMRGILNEAPVFHLDLPVIQRVGAYCSANPQDLLTDPLPRLPFDQVVLANPYNAILLYDADEGGREPDSWEIGSSWRCNFLQYFQEDGAWFSVMGTASLLAPDPVSMARCIHVGDCGMSYSMTENDDAKWAGSLSVYTGEFPEEGGRLRDMVRQAVSMALDACRYIQQPRHHLVVEEPRTWKAGEKRVKIPRAGDRPRVRIVQPEEVRRIYPHQTDTTGRTVTPHARRGHTKVLRHPRYKEAQGRRIVIAPTWVGDPSWSHGDTHYRVIYRKPAEVVQ